MARPIYIAIMAASEAGRGLHLTADEVWELSRDDAVSHRAAVTLPDDNDFLFEGFTWATAYARLRSAPHPRAPEAAGERPQEASKPLLHKEARDVG
jgi:hypothetical protein